MPPLPLSLSIVRIVDPSGKRGSARARARLQQHCCATRKSRKSLTPVAWRANKSDGSMGRRNAIPKA